MDVVFLSPHLDDVVVSCGGTLSCLQRVGVQVEVVTVFAGSPSGRLSPFAEWLHQAWGLPYDAPACRRREDRRALSSLGARRTCLSFRDSIYRRSCGIERFLYASKEEIFSGTWRDEPSVMPALVEELQRLLTELAPRVLCAPLGLGGHVDHLLVHLAAKRASKRLVFYEDLPYALHAPSPRRAAHLSSLSTGSQVIVPLTELDVRAKERAIRLYTSQLQDNAEAIGISIGEVLGYASLLAQEEIASFGERYWASREADLDPLRLALNLHWAWGRC